MEKQSTLCRYFLHGACSRGGSCNFRHDLNAKQDNVCKFYLAGQCGYGKQCRYDHVRPYKSPNVQQSTGQTTQKETKAIPLLKKKVQHTQQKNPIRKEGNEDCEKWKVNAPVFIPGKKIHKVTTVKDEDVMKEISFSKMASFKTTSNCAEQWYREADIEEEAYQSFHGDNTQLLCPFAAFRECPFKEDCDYLHGDICDMCGKHALHPNDIQQRKVHQAKCEEKLEKEMKFAFAAQRSDGITCSICLDVVKEKLDPQQQYFGLLENCTHPFCLECIRKWRSSYGMEKTVIRTCPICREQSWFVTPSEFWIEDPVEKQEMINQYKAYLSKKPCRLFDQGNGNCPFGTSCFYKHAYSDGTLESKKPELRYLEDSLGNFKIHKEPRLDEFLEAREMAGYN